MGLADDAVTGSVRLAEAIVQLEFVKAEVEEFAASIRAMDYPDAIRTHIHRHVRLIRARENNTAMLLWGLHL